MRAVIYARQSKDSRGDEAAVSRQLSECRDLVVRNGWTVAAELTDNDRSATKGERPAWKELLAQIGAGRYDVLVCWHTDRLYRQLRDLVELLEVAEKASLRIAAVRSGDLDLSTPAGRMVASMLGSAAAYEVQHKGERQRAGNRARASRGHVGWSLRPYGLDRVDGRVVVVEDEAKVLREAAERVLSGEATLSVVNDFNARGLTTTTGKPWQVTPLRRMLTSPRLAGRVVYKGEDFGRGADPAVFDPETHDRLVALYGAPGRNRSPSPAVKYLLSGLLTCGRCGSVMFAMPAYGRHMAYVCKDGKGHVSRKLDHVDPVVEGVVLERLSRPDAAALLAPDVDLDALRAKATEVRHRRDSLAELLASGLLSADAVKVQADRLTTELTGIERDIDAATGSHPASTLVTADDVAATWDASPLLVKREVIRALLTVTVHPIGKGRRDDPSTIEITWKGSAS